MFGSTFPVFIWNTCVISFDDHAFNIFIGVSIEMVSMIFSELSYNNSKLLETEIPLGLGDVIFDATFLVTF